MDSLAPENQCGYPKGELAMSTREEVRKLMTNVVWKINPEIGYVLWNLKSDHHTFDGKNFKVFVDMHSDESMEVQIYYKSPFHPIPNIIIVRVIGENVEIILRDGLAELLYPIAKDYNTELEVVY